MKVKLPVARVIAIKTEYIKLDSLLKLAGIAMTGGEAKVIIADGGVTVDGVTVDGGTATERGRKIRAGMTVRAAGQTIKITAEAT